MQTDYADHSKRDLAIFIEELNRDILSLKGKLESQEETLLAYLHEKWKDFQGTRASFSTALEPNHDWYHYSGMVNAVDIIMDDVRNDRIGKRNEAPTR